MPTPTFSNDANASPMRSMWVLMFGAFAMANAKFAIFPLMPTIAADLNSSPNEILHAVFAYFWGGLIAAPIMAIVFRHWSKPRILSLLSIWCFLGNFLTSFATSAESLYWLRWFSGIPHAGGVFYIRSSSRFKQNLSKQPNFTRHQSVQLPSISATKQFRPGWPMAF